MPAPLLRLSQLRKRFGAVQALTGVSFDLFPGEVHALVGENGAGKSTLVNLISGALRADTGNLEVAGATFDHLTPARSRQVGIACIYQQPALFPDLTVAENVGLRLEPASAFRLMNWSRRRERARELLQRVGASVSPDAEVGCLSMPDQQLVEIACALGANARIIIMDEPTACLTQREQHLLFCVVRDLRHSGIGVVYVSHRLEEVFALADRVTVLRDGATVGTNRVEDLTESTLIRMMVGREVSLNHSPRACNAGHAVLSMHHLGCSFSGVRDIDLELRSGEVLGLSGLVGAGRTELARTIFGITPADSGEMLLSGRPVVIRSPQEAVAQGIAYVPEDRARHGVIGELPIAQNITLAIHPRIFPKRWLRPGVERRLAEDFIRELGIVTQSPDASVTSLSGGNQQKVSVARWLAARPKVLIVDEPTQGVDVGAKSQIHSIIRGLAEQRLAVLLISSDLPEIVGLSDRIGVMRAGRLVSLLPAGSDPHDIMTAAFGQKVDL